PARGDRARERGSGRALRELQGDGAEALDRAIELAARPIALANHVVALVGAGLAAESGVPTFRGPDGLWTKHGEPGLRDYGRFVEDPKRWWEMRQARASRC